jgi:hypothetical protein
MRDETVELANRQSPAMRAVFLVLGFGVGILPPWDLLPGLMSRWAFAAIVWIIVVGALALAAILIGGAVFGYATVPSVAPVGITVERQTPWCTAWSAGFSQATSARSASSPKRGTMGWTLGG